MALIHLDVDGLALGNHLCQWGGGRLVVDQPDHDRRGVRSCQVLDRGLAEPRRQDTVERAGRAAALHMAQDGHACIYAGARLDDLGDGFGLDRQAIGVACTLG